MYGFVLDHSLTSSQLGVRLRARVDIPVAQQKVEDIEVAGRDGTLTRFNGWHDTRINLSLAQRGGIRAYQQTVTAFYDALTISFTGEPDTCRRIKHVRVEPLRQELCSWSFFDAELVLEPFAYLKSGLETITLTKTGSLTNPGMVPSAPVITVYGARDLRLRIGSQNIRLDSPVGKLTLDSMRLLTHIDGRIQTDGLTGPFPVLGPGTNRIELGPGIKRIEVQGNWRNP